METITKPSQNVLLNFYRFRSDYEGWKLGGIIVEVHVTATKSFRSDYEGWKLDCYVFFYN